MTTRELRLLSKLYGAVLYLFTQEGTSHSPLKAWVREGLTGGLNDHDLCDPWAPDHVPCHPTQATMLDRRTDVLADSQSARQTEM